MESNLQESEIKAMIQLLDDSDRDIYGHIEERLISLGREVIPMLEDAWSNAFDPVMQERIEHIVHKIQFDTLEEDFKLWLHTGTMDLLQGALLVARYQYPDLDMDKLQSEIKQIRKDIWIELNEELTALEQINVVNHIFFGKYGFSGNTTNYHAPQNSFINCVLESKKGNPLALATIYLLVAQSLDLPIYGVNLPEHFILAYLETRETSEGREGKVLFYINPFSKGTVFGKSDIDQFIRKLNLEPQPGYYNPCNSRDMVLRMLRNLSFSYQRLGDTEKVEELAKLIALFNS